MKCKYDVIFIGYVLNGFVKEMVVNLLLDVMLNLGDILFYIVECCINVINWFFLDVD